MVEARKRASQLGLWWMDSGEASWGVPMPLAWKNHAWSEEELGRSHTESRNDNNLRPIGNQLAKRLWKGQIPANQHTHPSHGRVNRVMALLPRGSQMWSFRMPDILLPVRAQNTPIVGDKVCRVVEQTRLFGTGVLLNDRPWNKAYLQFLGESLVVGEVFGCIAGLLGPAGVMWDPAA